MQEEKIIMKLMHDNEIGCSITELVLKTNFSRSLVRTSLARMEGAEKIKVRKVGMAKVYMLNTGNITAKTKNKEKRQYKKTFVKYEEKYKTDNNKTK